MSTHSVRLERDDVIVEINIELPTGSVESIESNADAHLAAENRTLTERMGAAADELLAAVVELASAPEEEAGGVDEAHAFGTSMHQATERLLASNPPIRIFGPIRLSEDVENSILATFDRHPGRHG